METEAIDNQANLVNYDNENENEIDDLGYQSEEYIEDAHEDDENNHSNGYAKRGITIMPSFQGIGKTRGVKLIKETEDKIKEGTLQVDQGTDAMTLVLGKEKGGYARGVGSGVTYKGKMSQTEGMVTTLKNQLAVYKGAVAVNANSIDTTRCRTTVVGCDQNDASIQKEIAKKGKLLNLCGAKKTTRSFRKDSFKVKIPIQRKCSCTTTSKKVQTVALKKKTTITARVPYTK
ncbi:hypothetical protein Tco_0564098 [Tanacetum coccineum]